MKDLLVSPASERLICLIRHLNDYNTLKLIFSLKN